MLGVKRQFSKHFRNFPLMAVERVPFHMFYVEVH